MDYNFEQIYKERDMILVLLARLAIENGYTVGIGIDEEKPDIWKYVLYIDLPTGQVSWHILENELPWFSFVPGYEKIWDGHSRKEKYLRLLKYAKNYNHYHRKNQ